MALLPTESSWNEGYGGLELCDHVASAGCPTQSSTHSSNRDAGCSSSEHYHYTANGGAVLESHATTLEDVKTNFVNIVPSPENTAVSRGASPIPHVVWDGEPVLVAESHDTFDLPELLKEDLTNHNDTFNHVNRVDNPIRFVTKVQKIRRQRQKVQTLRIQARDERSRMKDTRNRLQEAFRNFLDAGGTIPPQENSHDSATASLREMNATFKELEAQDIDLDMVESTLVPAEWELKDSEQQLYEDILGPSASDGNDSEISVQAIKRIPETLHDGPNQNYVNVQSPKHELTSQERLSSLARKREEVKDRLLDLTKEHTALQEDVQMRTAVGLPVDKFSQEALGAFPKRRAQLMRELADLTMGINTLNDMVTEGPDLMSKESDALFGHDQFDDLPTDEAMNQESLIESDEALHLRPRDHEERNKDILPFLAQPILDTMSHVSSLEEQLAVPPPAQYSSFAWDLLGRDAESISVFVSMWILGCVRSSWWSLIRFIFMSDLDGITSSKTVEDYIKPTWFQSDPDHAPETYCSEDPECSGFLGDAVLTPLSDATDDQEVIQWESRPLTRRHSSGYSAAAVHRRPSNHTYPKTS
ncbi:uncharacterized protein PV07_02455 [Cladophialophora immunda]|uniref:Uncharacterized protein n=1 Tax=Cladophialophora immunda TaxID=569365 RepID=A0A0D1ZRR8_9EURO|nr:uncharacterized protein PV07_02455 [Cladophialophora immunda]KIW30751.1 hypothetical protein PV07_02455 [Cladophialophora immunda]